MKNRLLIGILCLVPTLTLAAGNHTGGHGHDENKHENHQKNSQHSDHHNASPIGLTGDAKDISKTITITMLETDDGAMLFEPAHFNTKAGETIRLSFINKGETAHEFVMDGTEGIEKHRKEMLAAAEHGHGDHHDHHGSNSISLEPGATGEIIWQFASSGKFEFACLIPGHYELGMHGILTVE